MVLINKIHKSIANTYVVAALLAKLIIMETIKICVHSVIGKYSWRTEKWVFYQFYNFETKTCGGGIEEQ